MGKSLYFTSETGFPSGDLQMNEQNIEINMQICCIIKGAIKIGNTFHWNYGH